MASISFRPSVPADGPAITALLTQAFDRSLPTPTHGSTSLAGQLQHWKYWQPRDDWPGVRSYLLERDGEILAHAGVVPGRCRWEGGTLDLLHMIDWVARPGALGAGAALLKQLARLSDALLAIGGTAHTLNILPAMGFQTRGNVVKHTRVLRPMRRLSADAAPAWRVALRTARDLARVLAAGRATRSGGFAVRLSPGEVPQPWQTAGEPVSQTAMAVMERTPALFAHALGCPVGQPAVYRVDVGGAACGDFLLSCVDGQARLADCQLDSREPSHWRALVHEAVVAARRDFGAIEIVGWADRDDELLSQALQSAGFHPGMEQPVRLLARADRSLPGTSLRVQMLDNDALWL